MAEKQYLDQGEKKEILNLLERLESPRRVLFLSECCKQAKHHAYVKEETKGEVLEIWADMLVLATSPYWVPMRWMLEVLRNMVRGKG